MVQEGRTGIVVNSSPTSLFGIHVPHFLGFAFSTTYTENRISLKPPRLFWGALFCAESVLCSQVSKLSHCKEN